MYMPKIKTLKELFHHELRVLWNAESLLMEAMPAIIARARNQGLKKILSLHLAETDQHQVAIDFICKQLEVDPAADFVPGIKSILDEASQKLALDTTDEVTDTSIIASAQKIEHYEISNYGSAACYADILGYEGIARRLRLTLVEEQESVTKLTFLARSIIRPQ